MKEKREKKKKESLGLRNSKLRTYLVLTEYGVCTEYGITVPRMAKELLGPWEK